MNEQGDLMAGSRGTSADISLGQQPQLTREPRKHLYGVVLVGLCLFLALGATSAFADGDGPILSDPTLAEVQKAEENGSQQTDPEAAAELPHQELSRSEALELMTSVFGPVLEGPAGIFTSLHVEKFLSDNAAVISADEVSELFNEGSSESTEGQQPRLLESTTPLRTEGPDGEMEAVDLSLEPSLGELRPANPLVEVGIPSELGNGIQLPETGVQIELEGAPQERAPSTVSESVAFYPNVAKDTDLAVSPTPTGVETLSQLRSAEAPHSQTFNFALPVGATLQASEDGGAEATLAGKPLLNVLPPTALDANGNSVPTSLEVEGDSLTVKVAPGESTAFPIEVDPTIEDAYNWYYTGYPGWTPHNTGGYTNAFRDPDSGCSTYCYLRTSAMSGTYEVNTQSYWQYAVPRFFKDYEEFNERPKSWIQAFHVGNITFATAGDWQASPGALFAVSDENGAWRSASLYPPNQSGGYGIDLANDHSSRLASFGIFSSVRDWISAERYLLTGEAQVVLGDEIAPSGTSTAPKWVNKVAEPIGLDLTDTGLGVSSVTITQDSLMPNAVPVSWKASAGCIGTSPNPCPRRWKSAEGNRPALKYEPTLMPSGVNELTIRAADPVGNSATTTTKVKVDHLAPELALSGSITEQAALGVTRPQYVVKLTSKDGKVGEPQSGIASTVIKVDKQVISSSAGCMTENCGVTREWTLNASAYSVGKHILEVIATDVVGNSVEKTTAFEIQKDSASPTLSVSGSLKTAPNGWINQPNSYSTTAVASDAGAGVTAISFKVDGSQVGQVTQSCEKGGCALNKTFTLNSSSYSAGTHTAAVLATDGGGRTKETSWSFLVNPVNPTPADVAWTANALIAGSGTASPASKIEGFPYQPTLSSSEESENGTFEFAGGGARGSVSLEAKEGFLLSGLSGLPLAMAPLDFGGSALAGEAVAGGDGVGYPKIATNTDLLTRPTRNGLVNYLLLRKTDAPHSLTWELTGPSPITLAKRPDGGVNITIDPVSEVRNMSGDPAEGALTAAPQLVAVIAAPTVVDAAGAVVPATLSVTGLTVTLTIAPTANNVFPLDAAVQLHIEGALSSWNPDPSNPSLPSEIPVTAVSVNSSGEAAPVGSEWKTSPNGLEVTSFVPDNAGDVIAQTQALNPVPGTLSGGVVIQAPIAEYAPSTGATASCFLGLCAGGVVCAASGPNAPYNGGSGPVQTYALIACDPHGDVPKDFRYELGGACLQRRFEVNGQPFWATEKCHNVGPNTTPHWATTPYVTTACPGGIWRGEAWVTVSLTGAVSTTGSTTAKNLNC